MAREVGGHSFKRFLGSFINKFMELRDFIGNHNLGLKSQASTSIH